MNQFSERYKSLSNSELLKIIDNAADYQPLAVETARREINARKLTDLELDKAREELRYIQEKENQKEAKKRELTQNVRKIVMYISDALNPIQKSPVSTGRLINLISLVFAGIAVYIVIKGIGMLNFMFTENEEWDFSVVLYLLPLIWLPLATILFWARKRLGWTLLSIYLSYNAVILIDTLIITWNFEPTGIAALDSMATSPVVSLMTLIFYVATICSVSQKKLRSVFNINKISMITTMGITVFISTLIILLD